MHLGREEAAVDAVTESWPVPTSLRPELDDIKYSYRALPLHVFKGEQVVRVGDVNETLRGALVELHFELRHFAIHKKNQDSFNASIEQIIVLQPGPPQAVSKYKRASLEDGPICKKPTLELRKKHVGITTPDSPEKNQRQSHQTDTVVERAFITKVAETDDEQVENTLIEGIFFFHVK